MTDQTFKAFIDEKEVDLTVNTKIEWGKFQELLNVFASTMDATGKPNLNGILDKILQVVEIKGLPFPQKDHTKWKTMDAVEVSFIEGKLIEILPFEKLLSNLTGGKADLLGLMMKSVQ